MLWWISLMIFTLKSLQPVLARCEISSILFSLHFDNEIESRLKQVLDNLGFLVASKKRIPGFKEASGSGARSVSQKLFKTSLVGETVVCGRDSDKEIIFILLIYEIYMVGMGGIGETSLAQHLYNGPGMEGEFDVKAWVCVLDD